MSTPTLTLGTGAGQINPGADAFYNRVLTETSEQEFRHGLYADSRVLPLNHNNVIRFRRYENIAPSLTTLTDGITPTGVSLSKTDKTVQIQQYGNYIRLSDNVKKLIEDPITAVCSKRLGYNMGEVVDLITRNVLATCTNSVACTGGTNGGTPTELSAADINLAVQTLAVNKAKQIKEIVSAEDRDNTFGIRPSYIGLASAELMTALEKVSTFRGLDRYPSVDKVLPGEFGTTGGVRWIVTPNGYKDTTGAKVLYKNPILGQHAYARITLGSGANSNPMYVKELGSSGTADPLDQRASVGWKAWYACTILNDNNMLLLNCSNLSNS